MIKLSPNFTLEELTVSDVAVRHGWDNQPSEREIQNLQRLAKLLELIRKLVGKPIIVNSAYRSKRVNDAVGSTDRSQHRLGCAADIRVLGMTPDALVRLIIASGIDYDQVIREFDSWTHISVPNLPETKPRKQALIIDRSGTRPFT